MIRVSEVLATVMADNLLAQNRKMNANVIVGRGVIALSFSFFILGSGLCIYASYLWFVTQYSAVLAAYYTGVISLFMALLIALLAIAALQYRQSRLNKIRHDMLDKFHDFTALLDKELGTSIRENPKVSLLMATLSGIILEDFSRE